MRLTRFLKKAAFWISPGFLVWAGLTWQNARIYEAGLKAGKFPAHADAILIPVAGFSLVLAATIAGITALVFAVSALYRRFWPRYHLLGTAGSLAFIAWAAWVPYLERSHARNIEDISRDVGFEIPKISETLMYRTPWRLSLDDYSCSILYVPEKALVELQHELDEDEGWTDERALAPEADWDICLDRAPGFHFRAYRKVEESMETKILIGFDPARQLLLHAYANRLLPADKSATPSSSR